MPKTQIYWIETANPGRLAILQRPRGQDWLTDEVRLWSENGLATVVSLLEKDEQAELGLEHEAALCKEQGIRYISFPIHDRSVPPSIENTVGLLTNIRALLTKGEHVGLHCRMGIGRSGLIAASVLLFCGQDLEESWRNVANARGVDVPDTDEQRNWLVSLSKARAS